MSERREPAPITSPDDPRLAGMGYEEIAGEHQIPQMLAASPRERLQYLLGMLDFEDRAHRARVWRGVPPRGDPDRDSRRSR